MKPITDYTIVSGTADEITAKVQKLIKDNWQPFGAIAVTSYQVPIPKSVPPMADVVFWYVQVMVK